MSTHELVALINGTVVARITMDRHGRLRLTYESEWRSSKAAVPISLSMPLAASTHEHEIVDAFLWNLLPDNPEVVRRWGERFQVSATSAFGIVRAIGQDCPGAVQFVPPALVSELQDAAASPIRWLTEVEVGDRLRALRADASAARMAGDPGQFSLAGAQAKTALLCRDGQWGVPSGRVPTTHIVKPPIPGMDGIGEVEHFCLRLARSCGLSAAHTEVRRFDGEVAIVVERYDRMATAKVAAAAASEAATAAATVATAGDAATAAAAAESAASAAALAQALATLAGNVPYLRVHQEDACQALGRHPRLKYQNEGGPTPKYPTWKELEAGWNAGEG